MPAIANFNNKEPNAPSGGKKINRAVAVASKVAETNRTVLRVHFASVAAALINKKLTRRFTSKRTSR